MALNIPNVGSPGDALLKGLMTGSNLYSNAMHPIIQREQLAQARKNHLEQLALAKSKEDRLKQMFPLQMRNLQQTIEQNDPGYLEKLIEEEKTANRILKRCPKTKSSPT